MPLEINILEKTFPIYGFFCLIGVVIALFVALILAKKSNMDLFDFVLVAFITLCGAWLGAKLLFLIVSWKTIIQVFEIYPFFEALQIIIKGGYVFYGGLIGGVITLITTLKIQKKNILEYMGIYSVVLPLGHSFGRIGCFFAGCCFGKEYNGIFSHTYTQSMDANTPIGVPLFPIQIVEAICLAVLSMVLLILFIKCTKKNVLIYTYCICYPIIRFVLEFYRGDMLRGVFLLSTSQWISLCIIVLMLIYLRLKYKKKLRKIK